MYPNSMNKAKLVTDFDCNPNSLHQVYNTQLVHSRTGLLYHTFSNNVHDIITGTRLIKRLIDLR